MLARAIVLGTGMALSISAGAQTPAAPLVLEAKISLGQVNGRIDHLAVDLKRRRLFVAELGNDSLGVVDLATQKVLRTIAGLSAPQGVAYEPTTDAGDGSVRVLRGEDLSVVGRIDLGDDADNVRIDAARHRVLVGYGDGALAVIDPTTRAKVADTPLKAHPESFRIDGDRAFVNVPDGRLIQGRRSREGRGGRQLLADPAQPTRRTSRWRSTPEAKRLLVVKALQPAATRWSRRRRTGKFSRASIRAAMPTTRSCRYQAPTRLRELRSRCGRRDRGARRLLSANRSGSNRHPGHGHPCSIPRSIGCSSQCERPAASRRRYGYSGRCRDVPPARSGSRRSWFETRQSLAYPQSLAGNLPFVIPGLAHRASSGTHEHGLIRRVCRGLRHALLTRPCAWVPGFIAARCPGMTPTKLPQTHFRPASEGRHRERHSQALASATPREHRRRRPTPGFEREH